MPVLLCIIITLQALHEALNLSELTLLNQNTRRSYIEVISTRPVYVQHIVRQSQVAPSATWLMRQGHMNHVAEGAT